jgi:hypothetical protein
MKMINTDLKKRWADNVPFYGLIFTILFIIFIGVHPCKIFLPSLPETFARGGSADKFIAVGR